MIWKNMFTKKEDGHFCAPQPVEQGGQTAKQAYKN